MKGPEKAPKRQRARQRKAVQGPGKAARRQLAGSERQCKDQERQREGSGKAAERQRKAAERQRKGSERQCLPHPEGHGQALPELGELPVQVDPESL